MTFKEKMIKEKKFGLSAGFFLYFCFVLFCLF